MGEGKSQPSCEAVEVCAGIYQPTYDTSTYANVCLC